MNNRYLLLNNKRDFIYILFYTSQYRISHFFYKKQKKKIQNYIFPEGGLNPRTLDLKFTALTTRPIELTQDVDENDEGK